MAVKNITVATAQAKNVVAELVGQNILPTAVTNDANTGLTTITADLTPEQEKALAEAFANAGSSVVDAIKGGMDTVAEFTTDVADTAVTGIFVPLTGVAVKTAAGVGRIAVKATAQAGASVFNNLVEQGMRAVSDISNNAECNQVKSNFALLKAKLSKKPAVFKIS